MKKLNGILMLAAVLLAVAAIVQVKNALWRSRSVDVLVAATSKPGP